MKHRRRMKAVARVSLLAMLALAAGGLAVKFGPFAPRRPPNVLMIVADTLRADRLGAYGSTRGLTPFLDGLAAQGVVFANAYSTSSWTIPAVTSLFTSRYPSQHRVTGFGAIMHENEVTFAERLQAIGYVSGGFSANFTLKPQFGYARGFQRWVDEEELHGSVVRRDSLTWLDSVWHADSPHPVLLYVQFMEPHTPYDSREPFSTQFGRQEDGSPIDLKKEYSRLGNFSAFVVGPCYSTDDFHLYTRAYDAAVATLDDEIRLLFEALQQRRFLDNALIIVTADHGEEFGEHGRALHGHTLFNESVRVPLIFVGPDLPAGLRIEENASLIDISPTLLDLLGLQPEARFEGRSLGPLMQGATFPPRDLLLELPPQPVRSHEYGIVRGSTKLLIAPGGQHQAYDLQSDPRELAGVSSNDTEVTELLSTLNRETDRLVRDSTEPAKREILSETTKDRLRALGYQF